MNTDDRLLRLENAMTTLAEVAAKADTRLEAIEDLVKRLVVVTTTGFEETNAKINALADSHVRLLDSFERLAKAQEEAGELTRQNSEDISVLITTSERNSQSINALAETLRLLIERPNGKGE